MISASPTLLSSLPSLYSLYHMVFYVLSHGVFLFIWYCCKLGIHGSESQGQGESTPMMNAHKYFTSTNLVRIKTHGIELRGQGKSTL